MSGSHPCIKVPRKNFAPMKLDYIHLVLLEHLDRLVRLLVPLFECYFHFVLSKPIDHLNELFQGSMAFFVKSAVSEEFIEAVLLPFCKHFFE